MDTRETQRKKNFGDFMYGEKPCGGSKAKYPEVKKEEENMSNS